MKPIVRKILALVVVVAIGAVAGPWVYINLIKDQAPEALTLEPSTTTIAPESTTSIAAEFIVDMTTLVSDSTRRDRQVNTRILDTKTFPTATFVLKKPIALTPEALAGSDFSVDTTGTLTLRGVTKDIDLTLIARLVDDVIEVNGSIQIVFTDWSIPDPSISGIIVVDRGLLEFLLRFKR